MGFFDRPQIRQTPAPEPPGFDLLRDMLMRRAFEMNANPYGLNPSYRGPNPFMSSGRGMFNPYQGGYGPGGPGMGGMGGGGPMGGMGGGGGAPGGGNLMALIQQLLAQGGGGRGGPMTVPMRPSGPPMGGMAGMQTGAPPQPGGAPQQRPPAYAGNCYDGQRPGYDGGAVGVAGGIMQVMPDGTQQFIPWGDLGPTPGGGSPPPQEEATTGGGGGGGGGAGAGGGMLRRKRQPMMGGQVGYDAFGPQAVGVGGGYYTWGGPGGEGYVPWSNPNATPSMTGPATPRPGAGAPPPTGPIQGATGGGAPTMADRGEPHRGRGAFKPQPFSPISRGTGGGMPGGGEPPEGPHKPGAGYAGRLMRPAELARRIG